MTPPKAKRRKPIDREPVYQETRLSPRACPTCRRAVLRGTVKGEPRIIDRTRLSTAGEYAAMLDGQRTYQTGLSEENLFPRRSFHVNQGLPRFGRVLADHHCGWTWAPAHFDMRSLFEQGGDGCPPF